MTEQTPKFDAKTLDHIYSWLEEEYNRLTRIYNQMMERGARNDAKTYILSRRREVRFLLSSEIFRLIEQQEAE